MRRRRQHGVPVIGALVLLALLAVIAAAVQIAEHLALLAVIAAVAARAFYLGRRGRRQARPRQVQQQQVDPAKLAAATPLPAAAWPLADDRDELATPEPTILQGGSDKTRLLADPPTRRPATRRPAIRVPATVGAVMNGGIRLDQIRPVTRYGAPKGYVPYHPKRATRALVERITGLYDALREQDALPAGPRTIGYRLKEAYRGEYAKKDFGAIGETIKRLCQAGVLSFEDVSDASAVTHDQGGWDDTAGFLRQIPGFYRRDLRSGQPVVIEVITEAMETLGLISRLGRERGVLVYLGSGSSGPGLARKVALRALVRAIEHGQDTLIIGLGDFDQAGMPTSSDPTPSTWPPSCTGSCPAATGCSATRAR